MEPKTKLLALSAILLLLISTEAFGQRARTLVVACKGAVESVQVACTAHGTSRSGDEQNRIDLTSPALDLEVRPAGDEHHPREVRVHIASYSAPEVRLTFFLSRRASRNESPTLSTFNAVRSKLDLYPDAALAQVEAIERLNLDLTPGGTADIQSSYLRYVTLYAACTRLHYDVCEEAEEAGNSVLARFDSHPQAMSRQRISKNGTFKELENIKTEKLRRDKAEGDWHLLNSDYELAIRSYNRYLHGWNQATTDMRSALRYPPSEIERDIGFATTRMNQRQPAAAGSPAG